MVNLEVPVCILLLRCIHTHNSAQQFALKEKTMLKEKHLLQVPKLALIKITCETFQNKQKTSFSPVEVNMSH